jgi:DMSO reductase anchor subunit
MHPAFSVIFFTTASGAGYGLLAWLGVLAPFGAIPSDRWFGFAGLGVALSFITAGLLSSMGHLGRPERAWRAITQWRTSWLSREGVSSLATYVPAGLFGLLWVIFDQTGGLWRIAGLVTALMAAVTIYCTAMIYASLKPIHQWANGWVAPNYAALGLMTGALWLNALSHLWGAGQTWLDVLCLAALVVGAWLKISYWRFIDGSAAASRPETATGLKGGKVRFLEAPHTEDNYLLQEMGYRVARKHSIKLRWIALLLACGAPFVLILIAMIGNGAAALTASLLAAVVAPIGVLVERWLFFAEAKHTVTLYYGAETV